MGSEGVNPLAFVYIAAIIGLLYGLYWFATRDTRAANFGFINATLTAQVQIGGQDLFAGAVATSALEGRNTVFGATQFPTWTPEATRTQIPTRTPEPTRTPSPTPDVWATEYWITEATRQAFFTSRGVLAPATPCPPFGCDTSITPVPLAASPTPDYEQTRALVATVHAVAQQLMTPIVAATANARVRGWGESP